MLEIGEDVKKFVKKMLCKFKTRKKNVFLGQNVDIAISSVFGGHNYIGSNTVFEGTIGYGSYIGSNSNLMAKIGKFSSISGNVNVVGGTHPTKDFVSTHSAFYRVENSVNLSYVKTKKYEDETYIDREKKFLVEIGNDVWIGFGATILGGVKIGDGAIIAAGAVVNKDVEPYSIVGGVPAKVIRYRFEEEVIRYLLKLKWWNKDIKWIEENAELFENIVALMAKQQDISLDVEE